MTILSAKAQQIWWFW